MSVGADSIHVGGRRYHSMPPAPSNRACTVPALCSCAKTSVNSPLTDNVPLQLSTKWTVNILRLTGPSIARAGKLDDETTTLAESLKPVEELCHVCVSMWRLSASERVLINYS